MRKWLPFLSLGPKPEDPVPGSSQPLSCVVRSQEKVSCHCVFRERERHRCTNSYLTPDLKPEETG